MPHAFILADLTDAASGNNAARLILIAVLFLVLGAVFFVGAIHLRRAELLSPPPPPPLQLLFDSREHVSSDGRGCCTVSVQVKNTSRKCTFTNVDVRLEALEALYNDRRTGHFEPMTLRMPLMPARGEMMPGNSISLLPGESVSYIVARSVIGDGFLYLPGGQALEDGEPRKVTLAPYLARLSATATNAPQDDLAIELPVAGRTIGTPRPRYRVY